MSQLKTAAAAICGTMVLTAVIMFLVPQKDHKMMKFAVRIFFILSLLLPFAGWKAEDFVLPEISEEDLSGELDALVQRQLEQSIISSLESQAAAILEKHGVSDPQIEITIHNREDTGISITSLKVLAAPEEMDAVASAVPELTETFGVTVALERAESQNDGEAEKTDGE